MVEPGGIVSSPDGKLWRVLKVDNERVAVADLRGWKWNGKNGRRDGCSGFREGGMTVEMLDEQIVALTKTDDDTDLMENMKTACGLFLTAERKFRKISAHPDVVTDPVINCEWWDCLEMVYKCEKTVWRMFVGPQPTMEDNRLYAKFREMLLKGSSLKSNA